MLDGCPRVVCSIPGAHGLAAVLKETVKTGTVVTAYDDGLMRSVRPLVSPDTADLVPFGELVGRFCRMWGIESRVQATTGQRQAVAQQAMTAQAEGAFFRASASHPGACQKVVEVIREVEHGGYEPDQLEDVACRLAPGPASRVNGLAELMRSQAETLGKSGRETTSTRIHRCLALSGQRVSPIKHVVCLTHGQHAPLFDRWLVWLAASGIRVDLITEPVWQKCFLASRRRFVTLGADPQEVSHWTAGLFSEAGPVDVPVEVEVFRAGDALAECEWLVRRCLALRQEGVPDEGIAIVTRDAETYGPLLVASATRLGLPLSATWRQPLLSNGMAGTVLATLNALASPDVRTLGRVARTSFLTTLGCSPEPLWDLLRDAYAAGPRQWDELASNVELAEEGWPWLAQVLEWRSLAVGSPCPLADWIRRLRALAQSLTSHQPEGATADRDGRAQNVMQRSLGDLVPTRPEGESLTLRAFAALAARTWEGQEVSVDDRKGGVWVGHSALSIPPVRVVMAPGMVEGALPRRRSQDPVIGDKLRVTIDEVWQREGTLLNSEDVASAERDEFVRLCASAQERLVFCFPEGEGDDSATPTYFLRELARLVGKRLDTLATAYPRSQWFPDLESCRAMQDHQMVQALTNPPFVSAAPEVLDEKVKAALRLDPDAGATLREIADFSECPFRATARHRLRLYPNRPFNPFNRLVDLPGRASIQLATHNTEVEARLHKALEEKVNSLFTQLEPWEAHLLRAAGERLIETWSARETLARATWERTDWTLDGFPVHSIRLGEAGTRDYVPIGGGQKVRVVTDPMPVYRVGDFMVVRLDEASMSDPKGGTRDGDLDAHYAGTGKWLRHGLILACMVSASPAVGLEIEAMGPERWMLYLGGPESPPPFKMTGSLRRAGFGQKTSGYYKEVVDRAREVLRSMLAGRMTVEPGAACTFCDYGGLCRRSPTILGDQA